jgi:hypothetical protein
MGTAAKIALGVVVGGVVLVSGCAVACGVLVALGYHAQQASAEKCRDLADVHGTSGSIDNPFSTVHGVIENHAQDHAISYVAIDVQLLDAAGNVVASDWTNATDIQPGERRPFEKMIRTSGLGRWSKYRLGLRECRMAN